MPQFSTDAPIVRTMRVVPVAGYDSMLLNLSGAHGPVFTRNIVIVTDSRGATGIGEVPGGEGIRRTLEECAPMVIGTSIANYRNTLRLIRERFADRDASGREHRPTICVRRSMWLRLSNARCWICSDSSFTCRSRRC